MDGEWECVDSIVSKCRSFWLMKRTSGGQTRYYPMEGTKGVIVAGDDEDAKKQFRKEVEGLEAK